MREGVAAVMTTTLQETLAIAYIVLVVMDVELAGHCKKDNVLVGLWRSQLG
jgi:hypothetical protein